MSHGNFANELLKSAEMIIGKIDKTQSVSLKIGMSIEELLKEAEENIKLLPNELIILTDMFGGTPNNVAMVLMQKYDAKVICGVNLPMLMELVISRDSQDKDRESIIESVMETGKSSIQLPEIMIFEED